MSGSKNNYVAYVGSHSSGKDQGLYAFDIDVKTGEMSFRDVYEIHNPSYFTISNDGQFLYAVCDEGVSAFEIKKDGDLKFINCENIGGMRGCYICVDSKRRYAFIGGYHDGRVTMMRLNQDGSIKDIADGVFHQGAGISSVDRRMEPKVRSVTLTPDERYLCAVDNGIDQVKIYEVDYELGKLTLSDTIRCPFGSSPRMIRFSKNHKFAYLLLENTNQIQIYSIAKGQNGPEYEKIGEVDTLGGEQAYVAASSTIEITDDGKHLFCAIDASNSVSCFAINEDGSLDFKFNSKTSGDYPKDLCLTSKGEFVFCVNADTQEIRGFKVFYDKYYCLQKKAPVSAKGANCMKIFKLPND